MSKRLAALWLFLLFVLPVVLTPTVTADYDGDGVDDASDSDDDNDGVSDSSDSCPMGTLLWISNDTSDLDGDGCKDRSVIVDFYDTEDWSYLEFTFSIAEDQEFDMYHICQESCRYETTISMLKPDGVTVFWGRYADEDEDEMRHTFPDLTFSIGRLSQISGMKGDVTYGDPSIEGAWNQPGTYTVNLTDLNEAFHEDGFNYDNGGVSLFIYLVGSEDAEDSDDDNDGVLDSLDTCMIGTTGWTSTLETDADGDGCRDDGEDDDDDNDGWGDGSDQCTNRRSDSVDGAGVINYPLTSSWEEDNSALAAATPHGDAAFSSLGGEDVVYLAGYDSIEFPTGLSAGLNHSDKVQFSLEFNLDDAYFSNSHPTAGSSSPDYQGDVGEGARVVLSNHPNRDDRDLGFSLTVEDVDEENFGLRLQVTQPPDNHFIHPFLNRDLAFGQWYSVRITYDFTLQNPTVEVLLGAERYVYIMTPTIDDLDCWKTHLVESTIHIGSDRDGGIFRPEWVEVGGEWMEISTVPSIGTYVRNFTASSPVVAGSKSAINGGLDALIEHMDGNAILDDLEMEQALQRVMMNLNVPWSDISVNTVRYIDTYASTQGVAFDGEDRWLPSIEDPLRYIAYTMQLLVIETVFTPENIDLAGGIVFADAEFFPGVVSPGAQRVTSGSATIRGTYAKDPGRSFGSDGRLIQPTGFYAAAGEIVTVSIAPEHVDGEFEVWVGAHQDDLRYSNLEYSRLPKIGTTFPIDSTSIEVANPFGGGIYVVTPNGAQEGDVTVTISGAVASPLYSTRQTNPVSYNDWKAAVEAAETPWVDIASDRFMTSLPIFMVDYSKDTLCTMRNAPEEWETKSCTFTVPAGESVTLESMLHYEEDAFTMEITYPNGTRLAYTADTLNDPDSGWLSAPSQINARVSDQSGEYKVELFSAVGQGGSSFQAAIMDYDEVFDPAEMLALWDESIDAYLVFGGWPLERGSAQQHMWLLPEVQTPASGTMAPAANPMSMEAPVAAKIESESFTRRDLSWWGDPRLVIEADFYDSGISVVWHEWGHLHNIPTLKSEGEAIANVPGSIILNTVFDLSFDDSLAYATFQMMNRSETAIDWMVTTNFRNDERIGEGYKGYTEEGYPLDQVSYQSRGNARYVDLAYMYNWEGVGAIHNVYYQRILSGSSEVHDASNPSDSDFVFAASEGLGVNMAPFFDFWGLSITQTTLDTVNAMPRSEPVKLLLLEYREIIPRDLAEFTEWHDSIKGRIGTWQGPQVESYLDTYDDATGLAGLDRIDTLLCLYFEVNCENVPGVIPFPWPPGGNVTDPPDGNVTDPPDDNVTDPPDDNGTTHPDDNETTLPGDDPTNGTDGDGSDEKETEYAGGFPPVLSLAVTVAVAVIAVTVIALRRRR